MKTFSIPLLVSLFVWGCSPKPSPTAFTVSDVMDDVITRLYREVPAQHYDTLSDKFLLGFLTASEKEVLATRYQYFTVNVPVVVSLMRHVDQKVVPFWIGEAGFRKTDLIVRNESYTYEVWQKDFPAGKVSLGINGFDKHRPVYFVSVAPKNTDDKLEISDFYPAQYEIATLEEGAFTYHDWSDLLIVEVPDALKGQKMFTTVRGRAREAHVVSGFRTTPYPSSSAPDQILLTWSESPVTTMDIQWRTDTTVQSGEVRFWKINGTDTASVNASSVLLQDRMLVNDRYFMRHTALLRNLEPGTTYGYSVGTADGAWSGPQTFKTSPDDANKFSFVWFGDTHTFPDSGRLATLTRRHKDAAFYTIAGDIVSTGLYRDDWDRFFEHSRGIFSEKPLMPVPGNHDRQDGLGAKLYYDLFSLPQNGPKGVDPESTYAFEYGDALFLMIDATSDWDAHTPWIEEQLKRTKAKWKIANFHFPPYNYEDPYPELQEKWIPLFDKYHVDLVIGGHIHYYMRSNPMRAGQVVASEKDGTIYHISISIPARDRPMADESYAVVRFADGYYYQYVTIDGDVLTSVTYGHDGEKKDEYKLKK